MADIEAPLSYGRLTGDFWAVLEDSNDLDVAPDTSPLMGKVTFTPSYRVLRVSPEEVSQRGIVYVDTVTAQVANGVLVDDFGEPGVSLLAASDDESGEVFPDNISWTAVFNLAMSSGEALSKQPEPTVIRLSPGETKSISDFIPTVLESGNSVRVVSVDRETMLHVDSQVDYINNLVAQLEVAVEDGVVKGDKGDKGDTGAQGPIGPYGPPGTAGSVEIFNYVTNPVPTSNEGYEATNGTVSYSANSLKLTPTAPEYPSYFTWVNAIPAFPGTSVYLKFDAAVTNTTPVQTTITFLNANLEPVASETLTHEGNPDVEAPGGIVSGDTGTYAHSSYTDGPASFAVFSVGVPEGFPTGTTLTASKFFFSDYPEAYFSGSDTISGYNIRWMGAANASYSVMTPISILSSPTVTSVNGEQGDIVIDAETLGLGFVDNTSDADKPVSDATQAELDGKVNSDDLLVTVSSDLRTPVEAYYLKEFPKYATQEVWSTDETVVDVSYVTAPVSTTNLVRLTIPGSITGNSPSSIPTVETSADGAVWSTWRALTGAPPSSLSYTNIDGAYDRTTGSLKVVVREQTTAGAVSLRLYTITTDGAVTSAVVASGTTTANPFKTPSIVETPDNDGTLYLYYTDASGTVRRKSIDPLGAVGSTTTNMVGLATGSWVKVSRFYGTYVVSTRDGVAGSPGILISTDGVTWRGRTKTPTHTWSRGADAIISSAYPGVSKGRVGVFIDYVSAANYKINRLFATSGPVISGTISGLATEAGATSTADSAILFPGTLDSVPQVLVSTNDSRLGLGVIAVTVDGGTIERFNMGEAPSSNATISWTAIS